MRISETIASDNAFVDFVNLLCYKKFMETVNENAYIPIGILTSEVPDLCKKIGMPDDAAGQVISKLDELNSLYPAILKLTDAETGEEAYKEIEKACRGDDMLILAAFLTAAGITKRMYIRKGIDLSVFYESMDCFPLYVLEHMESFGKIGFDRGWWVWRHLSCVMFRIGTLEYEIEVLKGYDFAGAKDGETVISVHIPSNGTLSREELDDSYNAAHAFFTKHDIRYASVYCATWLLSPALNQFLPQNSRILEFQKDYELFDSNTTDESYFVRVFKRDHDNFNKLPVSTSLQRIIKRSILTGGSKNIGIGSASGILRNRYFTGR